MITAARHGVRTRVLAAVSAGIAAAGVALATPAVAVTPHVPPTPRSGISFNGTVYAVAMAADVVYAGGSFTSVTGTNGTFSRSRVAAINLTTGAVTTFRADANGTVRALALNGTSLFVGGDFSTLGGSTRRRLGEVNATSGAVTSFRLDAGSAVRALATLGDRLYVGGQFTSIGSLAQARVASVNLTTRSLDTGFRPVLNNTVSALSVAPNGASVYVGGAFTTVNGTGRRYLAALNRTGGAPTSTTFAMSSNYPVLALDTNDTGTRVYAAIGGAGNQVASFSSTSGTKYWRQYAEGDVQAVAYYGGNVFFGFHEGAGGDFSVRLLVADANSGALEQSFRPTVNSFNGVWALDATSRGVVAGGEFTRVNGVNAGRLAYFVAR
jgi:hypothetical protein